MKKRSILFWILGITLVIGIAGVVWGIWHFQIRDISATFCPYGKNHEFLTETTQADCTQRGYTTGTCQKCGYSYTYDIVDALGHQWADPISVQSLSCTEDGLQSMSCNRCGTTLNEPIFHSGHNYVVTSAEGDAESETVEYVCTVCGDGFTRNWDEPLFQELKDKTYLPDCHEDFSFVVSCEQDESYLRDNMMLTGEDGSVSYTVTIEEDGIYRIASTEPYQQYKTYLVQLSGDMIFPEYNTKVLEFSIIGPDRADVEFNEDNLVFLKALELQQYDSYGLYDLQWDELAQRYYLTMFQMKSIDPSLIGKVIGIGDYISTKEILEDSNRELHFAKLEKISHNAAGNLLLELSVPQLAEIYSKFDIYFAGGGSGIPINGDPELAFMNAVVNSEGFTEYLTAAHLAADSYAQDHSLVVTSLAATSKNNLQFELTKKDFDNTEDANTCKLELGGKITYTIPMNSKSGHASGSIVMTCNAEITAYISAGGQFKDKESVDLHLTNSTTTTLSFEMKFNLDYSNEYEVTYLVHNSTHKIHTATCRIAKKETNRANLQKLTAQQLSEMYNGDRDVMKQHECKICMSITGLDGTAYAYNKNTGVLHCMNCRHVTDIKACNLYTLYPDNTLAFTECSDCRPQDQQVKDFDNRMLNAIKGSDWGEQVNDLREMLSDTIGNQKPAPDSDPNLSVPINIAGVFNIEIGVAPVFEFDMEASVTFKITANTKNEYGIRNVGEGLETYHTEYPGEVNYDLSFTGEANAKFGIEMFVKAYPVGCEEFACIEINGQVGLYGRFTGIFRIAGTVGGDSDSYCAARLEAGLFAKMGGYWKILWFDNNFEILKEQRLPLFKWGYDRIYYAFEEEEIEWTVDDPDEFVMFNLPALMKAKYLDLTTMEYKSDTISPISKSQLNVTAEIKNEDGSPCDFLEYISENGMIHKKDSAPESFTAVITVQVTPRVQIDSLEDFRASKSKKAIYGYSMDPLVVKIKVEEKTDPYQDILTMYHASVSCNWTNCDGEGWDVVGDPDNACYILSRYEANRTLSEVGYALLDINNDAQPELFISLMDSAESGTFYDMYTISGGKILHVITAGERDGYSLAEGYSINNSGSSGAAASSDNNYRLDSTGMLKINQAVIYDGWRDSKNPWFYASTDYYNSETYETNYDVLKPISEGEALTLLDSFPNSHPLELIPFSVYNPSPNETISKETADYTNDIFNGTIQEFIYQREYQRFWNIEFADLDIQPEEYGIFDLDQDETYELIICGYEQGREWAHFILFEYSPTKNEITKVTIEPSETYEFSPGYCFMVDQYSPVHQALVITPLRYTQMTAIFEFWTKENGVLTYYMGVGWDTNEYGKYYYINRDRCTEAEKDEYLITGTINIDFKPLP